MRTLQEKYNAIQEGKFSKENFLADARMQQPQLITRFNGYDDAVQILKNRGMISEGINPQKYLSKIREVLKNPDYEIGTNDSHMSEAEQVWHYLAQDFKELDNVSEAEWDQVNNLIKAELKNRGTIKENTNFSEYSNDALTDMIMNLSRFEGNEDAIERVKAELARRKQGLKEAKQPKATKKGLADYRYKPTNEMDKYPYEQILRGIRVELEVAGVFGTPTADEYAKALAKVSKNLAKDSIFYTNQVAGVNPKVDQHDQMVTATAKNTVDTFNGMKKAELKEGFKKLIKKVLSESMGDMFGDEERAQRKVNYGQPGENEYEFYSDPENYNEEEEFELQEAKEDSHYKSELEDYLEDNQIYGYTNRIHDIMTGPDENTAAQELEAYLEDNQIYGRTYLTSILGIYSDYPYDQHWMNQPDEDEADDISHPRGYEEASDEESFEDLFEAADTEADRNMVRKLMTMYETEPSKFERLHKQTETQANTTQDIAFRRILSLMNRAKAGALQSLANQDRFEADREGMDEGFDEDKIEKYKQYTYTLDGETVIPDEIGFYNHYLGAELDGKFYKFSIPSEDGVVQLRSPQGKTGIYTENIFRSVSLKDLL